MYRLFFAFLVVFGVFSAPAYAAQPRFVQAYGDWDTYVFTEGDGKVCYMASRPEKAEGNYSQRGEVYAYITHRPGEKTRDVFGYVTGYTFKAGAEAKVVIDGNTTVLFTQDDKAWALDAASDKALADAVQKGSSMVVHGVSSRGTKTVDTFSLKGSSKAYEAISKECGL
jgi:hypothetical protein